jgi:hypothetical protein
MNRREAVFYLFGRIRRQFNSFQQIFSMFNQLSDRLRPVRSDHDWFDASQTPHKTPSLFLLRSLKRIEIVIIQMIYPFMLNGPDEERENRLTHQRRVITLADAIFGLRASVGHDSMVRRLRERDVKACYFEATTAAQFIDDGFSVAITNEVGVRGADFDFSAICGCQNIAVEVAARDDGQLSVQTIANTLKGKRSQFPKDRPGILVIVLPDEWAQNTAVAEQILTNTTRQFLARDTQRINAVAYVWSRTILLPQGRVIADAIRPYFNPNPRHPIADMGFLTPQNGDLNGLHIAAAENPADLVEAVGSTSHMRRFWQHYGPP